MQRTLQATIGVRQIITQPRPRTKQVYHQTEQTAVLPHRLPLSTPPVTPLLLFGGRLALHVLVLPLVGSYAAKGSTMKTPPSGSNSPRPGPGETPLTSRKQFPPTTQQQKPTPPCNDSLTSHSIFNTSLTNQPTKIQPTDVTLDSATHVHLFTTPTHLHLVATTSAEQSRQFWTGVQAGRDAAVMYRYLESIGDNRSLALASEVLRKRCPRRFLDAALSEFKFVLGEQFNLLIEPDSLRLIKVGALKTQSVGRNDGLGRILKQRRAIERTFLRGRIYRITSRLALPPQRKRDS